MATIDVKQVLDEQNLHAIFSQFDTDQSGKITKENIITAMQKIGHRITGEDLEDIMREHDLEKNGFISFQEFKALFLDITDSSEANKL